MGCSPSGINCSWVGSWTVPLRHIQLHWHGPFHRLHCRCLLHCGSLHRLQGNIFSTMVSHRDPGESWLLHLEHLLLLLLLSPWFLPPLFNHSSVPVHHFALPLMLSPRCHHLSWHGCVPSQLLLLSPAHLLVGQCEKQRRPWLCKHCSALTKVSLCYQ